MKPWNHFLTTPFEHSQLSFPVTHSFRIYDFIATLTIAFRSETASLTVRNLHHTPDANEHRTWVFSESTNANNSDLQYCLTLEFDCKKTLMTDV